MRGVVSLWITDDDGRLQLLGVSEAVGLAARVAQFLLEQDRTPSRDRAFREIQETRVRALTQIAKR